MPQVVLLMPHLTTGVNAPLIGSKCVAMYYLNFVEGCWHMQLNLFPKSPYKCSLPQNEHFFLFCLIIFFRYKTEMFCRMFVAFSTQ